jgi:FkbM family methyltransferase
MARSHHISRSDELIITLKVLTKAIGLLVRRPLAIYSYASGASGLEERIDKELHERYRRNPVKIARVRGFHICLNPKDEYISSYIGIGKSYELTTSEVFARLVKKGSVVFDVGANVGWFTLLAAKLTGGEGLVVSLEPEPQNFELLSKSVEMNHFDNVRAMQLCASDNDGQVTLYLATPIGMPGSHSMVRNFDVGSITAKASRLETIARQLGVEEIQLVKIDVEGAEPQVILGAKPLFESSKIKNLIMEWNPEAWVGHDDLLDFLFDRFDVFEISRHGYRPLKRIARGSVPLDKPNLYLSLRSPR